MTKKVYHTFEVSSGREQDLEWLFWPQLAAYPCAPGAFSAVTTMSNFILPSWGQNNMGGWNATEFLSQIFRVYQLNLEPDWQNSQITCGVILFLCIKEQFWKIFRLSANQALHNQLLQSIHDQSQDRFWRNSLFLSFYDNSGIINQNRRMNIPVHT